MTLMTKLSQELSCRYTALHYVINQTRNKFDSNMVNEKFNDLMIEKFNDTSLQNISSNYPRIHPPLMLII